MILNSVTTECLRKKFKNSFDLCNFAIQVGRLEIMSNPQKSNIRTVLQAVEIRASEHKA